MMGKLIKNIMILLLPWCIILVGVFYGRMAFLVTAIVIIAIWYATFKTDFDQKYENSKELYSVIGKAATPQTLSKTNREVPGESDRYAKAIKAGETNEFFLGNGKYLYPNYDWGGEHTPSMTFRNILEYGKKKGNTALLRQFEKDINAILGSEISVTDLLHIKTYIWIYIRDYHEEDLGLVKWDISIKTKKLFKQRLEEFISLYGTQGGELKQDSENNEFKVQAIIKNVDILRDRYAVNLME